MTKDKLTEILDKLKSVIDDTNNKLFMARKQHCKILIDKEDVIKSIINHVSSTFKSNDIKKIFELDDIEIEKIKQDLNDLLKKCKDEVKDIEVKDILKIYQELAKLKIMFLVNDAINSKRIIPLFIAKKIDEKGALIVESKSGNMIYFGELDDGSQELYHIDKKKQKYTTIESPINDINIILDCYSSYNSTYDLQSLIRKLNNGTFIENGVKIDCSKNLCFSLNALLETLLDSGINVAVIEYSARDVNKSISQPGINKFINLYNFRRKDKDEYKHLMLKEEKIKRPVHREIRIIKNGENHKRTAQFMHINLSKLEAYNNNVEIYKKILSDDTTKDKKMYEIFRSIIDIKTTNSIEKLVYKVFEFYYFLVENIKNDEMHDKLYKELKDSIEQYTENENVKKRIVEGDKDAVTDKDLIDALRYVDLKGLPYIHNVKEDELTYKEQYDSIKKMIIDNGLLMGVGGIAVEKNDINELFRKINITNKKDLLKVAKLYETNSDKSYHYFNINSSNYIQFTLGLRKVTLNNIYEFIRNGNDQLKHFTDNDNNLFREIMRKSCESMYNYYNHEISVSNTIIDKKGEINDVNNELLEKHGNNYGDLIDYLIDTKDRKIDSRKNIAVITIFNTLNIQSIKDTQFDILHKLIERVVKND